MPAPGSPAHHTYPLTHPRGRHSRNLRRRTDGCTLLRIVHLPRAVPPVFLGPDPSGGHDNGGSAALRAPPPSPVSLGMHRFCLPPRSVPHRNRDAITRMASHPFKRWTRLVRTSLAESRSNCSGSIRSPHHTGRSSLTHPRRPGIPLQSSPPSSVSTDTTFRFSFCSAG